MPFRCRSCQHLSRTDDHKQCLDRLKCDFERVAVVHYCSPEGAFSTVGMTGAVVGISPDGQTNKTGLVEVKAHCEKYEQGSVISDMLCAVTCLDCLATVPQVPNEDEDNN